MPFHPTDITGIQELEEADPAVSRVVRRGERHHVHQLHLAHRQLRVGVEKADGFDRISRKFDAVGVFFGEGEDVEDGTAPGELPGLENEILLLVLIFVEEVDEDVEGQLFPATDGEGVVFQEFRRCQLLGDGFRIGDDDVAAIHAGVKQTIDDFRTQLDIGGVGTLGVVRAAG